MAASDEVKTVKAAVVAVLGKCRVVARIRATGANALHVFIPERFLADKALLAQVHAAVARVTGRGEVGSFDPTTRTARPYFTVEGSPE